MTRRDKCFKAGVKAMRLNNEQAMHAWYSLAAELIDLGEKDVPKFKDLLHAILFAGIRARKIGRPAERVKF